MKMGQFDSAIDDYNSALRFEPKLASALYGRGLAKLKKGDKVGSDTDIAAAKKSRRRLAMTSRAMACSRDHVELRITST
jgi:Tetratricopeptide repeat.